MKKKKKAVKVVNCFNIRKLYCKISAQYACVKVHMRGNPIANYFVHMSPVPNGKYGALNTASRSTNKQLVFVCSNNIWLKINAHTVRYNGGRL